MKRIGKNLFVFLYSILILIAASVLLTKSTLGMNEELNTKSDDCLVIETNSDFNSSVEIFCKNNTIYKFTNDTDYIKTETVYQEDLTKKMVHSNSFVIGYSEIRQRYPSIIGEMANRKSNGKELGVGLTTSGDDWQCYFEGGPACYSNINGIQMVSDNEAWAVGGGGIILHYINGNWITYAKPNMAGQSELNSISMLSINDGWAVGFHYGDPQRPLALHWDGSIWEETYVPIMDVLYSVYAISPENVWASGGVHYDWNQQKWLFILLNWNGIEWKVKSEPEFALRKLYMLSSNDGWAIANKNSQYFLMHWNGSTFSEYNNPTPYCLNSLDFLSSDNGWVVGAYGTILHWDGSLWNVISSPTIEHLTSIKLLSNTNIWIMGSHGTILHWNGSNFEVTTGPTEYAMLNISMFSPSNGFAASYRGAILSWNGSQWTSISEPPPYTFRDISILSRSDGWAIANDCTNENDCKKGWGSFLHYDGVTWIKVTSPVSYLYSIDMVSETDGWATGYMNDQSYILHWDGISWSITFSPVSATAKALTDITMPSSNEGWIVGNKDLIDPGGVIVLHWNGSTWNPQAEFESSVMYSSYKVLSFDSNDVWIFGAKLVSDEFCGYPPGGGSFSFPTALHWNGNDWQIVDITTVPSDCGKTVLGADGLSTNDIWAFAFNLFRWNGSEWHELDRIHHLDLVSFSLFTSQEGWAVGDFIPLDSYTTCIIGYWDGFSWIQVSCPTAVGLSAVSMISPNYGWAVGDGALLYFDGTPPQIQFILLPIIER